MSTAANASSTVLTDGTPSHRLPSDRDTNTPFWNGELPLPLPEDTKRLFIEYSKIPEDKLEEHLVEAGDKLLDFGCALGQDLRSLAHAGAPRTNLFGADLVEKFFGAGFTLFKDAHSGITFRQADALDPSALSEWHGQFYRHSKSSFADFWTRMAARFGRTATVETRIDDVPAFELKGEAEEKFEPV
ncbi:hypothetical protein DHEL01_v211307 [Diaporthe helianthi]|uniref:Methyltransferase domain-containing protein n=1 Tax=Diaporthe helianthi TaxID=158607 RepID=A0A2P5HJ61_DIAHE|nr:hypothetical protein DHEL01_v211307 [Diaporthe helianthi]